MRSTCLAIV